MKRSIGDILKSSARTRGLTQADIAKTMKVSLPTVKRWFAGKGLDLDRLEKLLKILDLSLHELADSVTTQESSEFEFTLEQERAFVLQPELLNQLNRLIDGRKTKGVRKSFERSLRELERLGLLERHPRGRIKLLFFGQPRWRIDGPLAKHMKQKVIQTFLQQQTFRNVRMGLHQINADDFKLLEAKLIELQMFARSAEYRAREFPDHPVSIGLLVGCAPFSWEYA